VPTRCREKAFEDAAGAIRIAAQYAIRTFDYVGY
jgi:hypothetical protein